MKATRQIRPELLGGTFGGDGNKEGGRGERKRVGGRGRGRGRERAEEEGESGRERVVYVVDELEEEETAAGTGVVRC